MKFYALWFTVVTITGILVIPYHVSTLILRWNPLVFSTLPVMKYTLHRQEMATDRSKNYKESGIDRNSQYDRQYMEANLEQTAAKYM